MAQDGAAHDRKIRVGSDKIVGELLHEIKKLAERTAVDPHGRVLSVENDAVLVVVHIGRILKSPLVPLDGHRDDAVVLPGGVVRSSRVAFILPAELALRVGN